MTSQAPTYPQAQRALVVTFDGFPLGYEVFAGNTHDSRTLQTIVATMEARHGVLGRVWIAERGMASAANLAWLRQTGRRYIIGARKSELISEKNYGLNQLRYDLRKLKGHGLLQRDGSRYAYRLTQKGVQVALLFLFFDKRLCGSPIAASTTAPPPATSQPADSKPRITALTQPSNVSSICLPLDVRVAIAIVGLYCSRILPGRIYPFKAKGLSMRIVSSFTKQLGARLTVASHAPGI